MMPLKNFLNLIVFRDVSEPAVKLGKHNQFPFACPDIIKQSLKLWAFGRRFPRRYTGVSISSYNFVMVCLGPFLQRGGLRTNGQTVDCLLLCAYANI